MRPCAGFDESLVLAVKDCFLESDIRHILIGKSAGGVVFFSRLCTSLATDRRVCSNCDSWFTQISGQGKPKFFGIDNFLDKDNSEGTDDVGSPRLHKYAEKKKLSCPRCGKDFKSRKKYLKHVEGEAHGECQSGDRETVPGSKKVCEHCGALVSSDKMKQHVRRLHTKTLNCEHCDKQFKYRSELTVHLTHHTGELNFSCSACGKKFRRAAEVRRRPETLTNTDTCRPGSARRDTKEFIIFPAAFVNTRHTRSTTLTDT